MTWYEDPRYEEESYWEDYREWLEETDSLATHLADVGSPEDWLEPLV